MTNGTVTTIGDPSTISAILPSRSLAATISGFSEMPVCVNIEYGFSSIYETR